MISESMKARLTALIDPLYERECNALIPIAVKFANKQYGAKGPDGATKKAHMEWAAKWSKCFHAKRDRLYREGRKP
jgi:hypothetical protein